MTYFKEPGVEVRQQGEIVVWRLRGDWTRDLPNDRRRAAIDLVKSSPDQLVLDLSDVNFIDSWGEEAVCDVIQRVVEAGGRIVWVRDKTRRGEYDGVLRALQRRRLPVSGHDDLEAAYAAMTSQS
jgi:hypothetical protein